MKDNRLFERLQVDLAVGTANADQLASDGVFNGAAFVHQEVSLVRAEDGIDGLSQRLQA